MSDDNGGVKKDDGSVKSDNCICGMKIYFLLYMHTAIFICTRCGLGSGVSDPLQIVCYVCWMAIITIVMLFDCFV